MAILSDKRHGLRACVVAAAMAVVPGTAAWAAEHPDWIIRKFSCEMPET